MCRRSVGIVAQAATPPLHSEQPGGVAQQLGHGVSRGHEPPQLLQNLPARRSIRWKRAQCRVRHKQQATGPAATDEHALQAIPDTPGAPHHTSSASRKRGWWRTSAPRSVVGPSSSCTRACREAGGSVAGAGALVSKRAGQATADHSAQHTEEHAQQAAPCNLPGRPAGRLATAAAGARAPLLPQRRCRSLCCVDESGQREGERHGSSRAALLLCVCTPGRQVLQLCAFTPLVHPPGSRSVRVMRRGTSAPAGSLSSVASVEGLM